MHEELGDQHWTAGEFDKAAEAYREELRIDPHAVTSMYKLGSLLVLHQQTAEGVQLLRDTLRADPSLADAHYYLGVGLANLDQDEEAAHQFESAVAADPANNRALSAYYKLAQVYRKMHQPDQANAAMQNFLRMRAASKERQDSKTAQLSRKRGDLPVDDPEKSAMPESP